MNTITNDELDRARRCKEEARAVLVDPLKRMQFLATWHLNPELARNLTLDALAERLAGQ